MIAEELSGQHIGRTIGFTWYFPNSYVEAYVKGELREVHHTAQEWLFVHLAGDESQGDKTEFEIERGAMIALVD